MQIQNLNAPTKTERLDALRALGLPPRRGILGRDVNNHIHTSYSFSPYSPTMAVYKAYDARLCTAGIMDHDSLAGAREFLEAAAVLNLPVTVGMECRADFAGTPVAGRRINNTDQDTVAYIALHGVPHNRIDAVTDYFAPYVAARGARNRAMTANLHELFVPHGLTLDYDRDVLPLSMAHDGGSVTERHLLFAVAKKIVETFGRGQATADFCKKLQMPLPAKLEGYLLDEANPHYEYDLLGLLKGNFMEAFYIPATAECPPIHELSAMARENGIVMAYPYLGDVGDSVTGDKKPQRFEDGYLDELFELLPALGFPAVTYMPSRNTPAQLARLRALCDQKGLFQISGEDINQPRQGFVCEAMRRPEFAPLYDAAWALIGHERRATKDLADGMFSEASQKTPLSARIENYRDSAMSLFA